MIHLVLSWLWDTAWAQFGLAGLVLIASIAAFLYLPLPGVRQITPPIAGVCVVFLFLGPKLYFEGVHHERAKWEAAERAAEQRAAEARQQAEQEIPETVPVPEDAPPANSGRGRGLSRLLHHAPKRVRHDKYERDKP